MSYWLTWFHFLTLSFLLVHSHICVCYYNNTAEEDAPHQGHSNRTSNNSALFPRAIEDLPVAASLVLVDDIAIAACQTVWLNKLHRATYGSPTDIPFLLPPQFPATNVTLEIKLISLAQISPSIMSIRLSILPTWSDPRFGWDSKLDCPLSSVQLRSNKIWRPSFTFADQMRTQLVSATGLPLTVTATSRISFSNPVVEEATCYLTARLFPYDQQHCRIIINAENGNGIENSASTFWHFDMDKDLNLGDFLASALIQTNWQVNGIFSKVNPDNDGQLVLFFRLERRNKFAFNLWLTTSVFLTLLVGTSLGLEPSSVEKMVTSFLAIVGYLGHLLLLVQILPLDFNTDGTVPLLLDFSLVNFVICVSAVGLNGVVVNMWRSAAGKTACEISEDGTPRLVACCNHLSSIAIDKATCIPSTSCIEDLAMVTHCKGGPSKMAVSQGSRVYPTADSGKLVSTDPITVAEKGSIAAKQFCASPAETSRNGGKCRNGPKNWMQKTLLVSYFITMLLAYATFIVIMVIQVAEAKASAPVSYQTPF